MALTNRSRQWLAVFGVPIRVYLGGVFVFASLYKIQEPYDFALAVATYQIAPLPLINIFALILPWVELIVGISLIAGFWTRENAFLMLGMMVMFSITLGIALSRGHEMTCGCFSSDRAVEQIGFHTLYRDILWLFMALYVLILDDGRYGLDGAFRRRAQNA